MDSIIGSNDSQGGRDSKHEQVYNRIITYVMKKINRSLA